MTPPTSLAIAIPTFRRPDLLGTLLDALPERIAELPDDVQVIAVIVVDNDPDESARVAAAAHPALPIRYVAEHTPGIAAVRNRAMDEAADVRLLAFIDDDEVPQPEWLSALVQCHRRYDTAAVMGRVISDLPEDLDPWLAATGTFRRKVRSTGEYVEVAAAGNLLLDLGRVRLTGVRFDESLGLAGGEDSLFSMELVRAGGSIVWCGESIAIDRVVPQRLTRAWARTRAFNTGNAATNVALRYARSAPARAAVRAKAVVGGAARVVVGLVRHLFGAATRRITHDARGWRLIHRGRGMAAGAFGHVHREYARTP